MDTDQRHCAMCEYFRDKGAMGLGCCERHRHVVFGGTPACDDAIKPETTSGIGKTIIVTLRKWFGKPTRDNL